MTSRADVAALLCQEVVALRARESRRAFDATVYVGSLDGARDSFVVRARDLPVIDRAVRLDVVSALVERLGDRPVCAWLTRPGRPDLLGSDTAWMHAARAGFAMHGLPLGGFWVVTPKGWSEVG
jgi:hypothetical protein